MSAAGHRPPAALAERLAALPAEKLALAAREARDRLHHIPSEPIAVIGMACRFPGGADSPEAFWELLRTGRSGITEVPGSRWDIDRYYDPRPGTPGKMYTRHGAFLDAVDEFDAEFFGLSPREAAGMDPQQRLLLETAWAALDDAACTVETRASRDVGVFVGIMHHDYSLLLSGIDTPNSHTGSGNGMSVAAGRIAHSFGFQGPTLAVDTACSSSLVALHLGCRSLQQGESAMALVGGVNLILSPTSSIVECEMRMLAPDGRCKTFDARADGFARGEACAVVLLKRLSDAIRDGDRVHAVVRGSAVNHDGRSGALTVPNGPAQELVIRAALRDAGVDATQVGYVEAHGTGTALGDPIELAALARAYGIRRGEPLAVGSVKTNIGHTESAAGMAGLFKAILALRHATIPPHLNFEVPNPEFAWDDLAIRVPTAAEPWPAQLPRRIAAVSSFSFSGTNVHVLLEAAAPHAANGAGAGGDAPYLLALSAATDEALRRAAADLADGLDGDTETLADVCAASRVRRSHLRHRAALTVDGVEEAQRRLRAVAAGRAAEPGTALGTAAASRPRVAFLFTGNGSQYAGMGRALYDAYEPARDVIDRCAAVAGGTLEHPLLDVLTGAGERAGLVDRVDCSQPALYALQCALSAVWRSWGVEPDAVAGHSIGEYAAAHVAGVFDLEAGMRLTLARGRLLRSLPDDGSMMACFTGAETVSAALEDLPAVVIAAINAPGNVVASGPAAGLRELAARLEAEGIQTRDLRVDRAYHSPATEPLLADFHAVAAECSYAPPRVAFASSLTGALLEHETPDAGYWTRHIRQPVRFARSIEILLDRGTDAFVELGPKATLVGLGAACAAAALPDRRRPRWVASLRSAGDDRRTMLDAAGVLASIGCELDHARIGPAGSRYAELPAYPFQRRRHWVTALDEPSRGGTQSAPSRMAGNGGHPLLGSRLRLAGGERRYESVLASHRPAYLRDHRVNGTVVLPGAAIVELLVAAAREHCGGPALRLERVEFRRAVLLTDGDLRTLQTVVRTDAAGGARIEIFMLDETADARWVLAASCHVPDGRDAGPADACAGPPPPRSSEPLDVDAYYEHFLDGGLDYGPDFRCIRTLVHGEAFCVAELSLAPGLAADGAAYTLHPVLLDGGLHAIGAALERGDRRTWVPAGVGAVVVTAALPAAVTAHVRVRGDLSGSAVHADVTFRDGGGAEVARLGDVRLVPVAGGLPGGRDGADVRPWLYEVRYKPQVRRFPAAPLLLPAPSDLATSLRPELERLRGLESLAAYGRNLERIDAMVAPLVAVALDRLGFQAAAEPRTAPQLVEQLEIPARFARLVARLLDILCAAGALRRSGNGYVADAAALAGLRAQRDADDALDLGALGAIETTLLRRCGDDLHGVLAGRTDPLALLFPDGDAETAERLYEDSPGYSAMNGVVRKAVEELVRDVPAGRGVRVLEVGAGTGGTTAHILPVLPADACEYVFTDVSPHFLARAERKFAAYRFLRTAVLDIESDPQLQGQHAGRYDLLVASNVVHATADLRATMTRLRSLLAPGGRLILVEAMAQRAWLDITFGLTEGWWAFEDTDVRDGGPLIGLDAWMRVLEQSGYCDVAPLVDGAQELRDVEACVVLAGVPLAAATRPARPRHLVLLADDSGVADRLAALAIERGHACTTVRAGGGFERRAPGDYRLAPGRQDDWTRLLAACARDASAAPDAVVDLWGLDVPHGEKLDSAALQGAIERTTARALALLPALVAGAPDSAPALTFVTRGACATRAGGALPDVAGALLWGLARAIGGEQPAIACRAVDLEPGGGDADVAILLDELTTGDEPESVAFRGGARLVPRLGRWQIPDTVVEGAAPELRADGAYLVTGGLGGLGLLTAEWAATRGARQLVLVGRRDPGPAALGAIAALRAQGVAVAVHALDVAAERDLATLAAAIDALGVPLRGIFHAAGGLSDGLLANQDRARFEAPLAAKVTGSWRLAQLAADRELDLFVLYSSAVALLGSPGQANHITACAFQDVLAHHLRARGVPALSINWGAWSEVGSAADPELLARLKGRGVDAIAPGAGLATLDLILQAGAAQVAVVPIDWPTVLGGVAASGGNPLLADLVATEQAAAASVPSRNAELLAALAGAAPDDVQHEVVGYLLQTLGIVLGRGVTAGDADRSLHELGLDSLIAIDLRNRILAELEVDVPIEEIVQGGTTIELAALVAATLMITLPGAEADPEAVYEEFTL